MNETTKLAMESVRNIVDSFTRPSDDVCHVALLLSKNGQLTALGLELTDTQSKDFVAELALPAMVLSREAIEVTMVMSMWGMRFDDLTKAMPESLANEPERVEIVLVTTYTAVGRVATWKAYLGRDPLEVETPTLSEFESWQHYKATSRFDEPLTKALQGVVG